MEVHSTSPVIVDLPSSVRVLSPRLLARALGCSLPTLWRMRQRGELPEPLRLSPGRVGWREADIVAWLEARAAEANG
jgi:prophage regulatory protein